MGSWGERVQLRTTSEGPGFARLREPRGGDELALDGVDTGAAVGLLDRLLDGKADGGSLGASDRDALLASLHRRLWGDRIVASLRCDACASIYDLSFELSDLQQRIEAGREPARAVEPRILEDESGIRFRLPCAAEEEAAAQLGLEAGRARLAASIAGEDVADGAAVEARLEALAPLIDVELEAPCAECGRTRLVRFDIQSFVLQRLLDERPGFLDEVHALGRGYGWSLTEILALPRSLRQSLARRLTDSAPAFGGDR